MVEVTELSVRCVDKIASSGPGVTGLIKLHNVGYDYTRLGETKG